MSLSIELLNSENLQFLAIDTQVATSLTFYLGIRNKGKNTYPT
jgi:hypothetical protein